jgi:SagB-type dehydrogenase family enzyme
MFYTWKERIPFAVSQACMQTIYGNDQDVEVDCMINRLFLVRVLVVLAVLTHCFLPVLAEDGGSKLEPSTITLPAPNLKGWVSVEQAINQRRSVRTYADENITLAEVSQLLWAAQGITEPSKGHRTAPSAQATYPLKVYLVAAKVTGLPAGVYLYVPQGHKLELVMKGDQRENVGTQPQMRNAPALLVYAVDYTATGPKYGRDKARMFAALEVGHSAQNVLLEEVSLGLIGVGMGGVDEGKIKAALKLPENVEVMYAVSAGKKAAAAQAH